MSHADTATESGPGTSLGLKTKVLSNCQTANVTVSAATYVRILWSLIFIDRSSCACEPRFQ
jgi:hypothetical protein